MRVYSVLYYTRDFNGKYKPFLTSVARSLTNAVYQRIHVQLLDSFRGNDSLFPTFSSLEFFLEKYEDNMSDLIIIIDCKAITLNGGGESELLRALILEYPEVKFLFDDDPTLALFSGYYYYTFEAREKYQECLVELDNSVNEEDIVSQVFKDNLQSKPGDLWDCLRTILSVDSGRFFPEDKDLIGRIRDTRRNLIRGYAISFVDFNLLIIPKIENSDFILRIVYTHDNLFDASNLRYAIKQWKYAGLKVKTQNFSAMQTSRRDYLALSVEEENAQNRFNSYCLYANGFRVMPVTCATDLKDANDRYAHLTPKIVLRDFDLQFFDANVSSLSDSEDPEMTINLIRGFREDKEGHGRWRCFVWRSPFWSSFYAFKTPVYYISKGTGLVTIEDPNLFVKFKIRHGKLIIRRRIVHYSDKSKGLNILYLPGLQKAVSGVHLPFWGIPEIRYRYFMSRKHVHSFYITKRDGHDHGTPLDVYSSVRSILARARDYYYSGKFVHAAVLSNEAMEYLNGFHQSLMIEAYYLNAISENAIAMDAMVQESQLKRDSAWRVKKIKEDVMRIYSQPGSTNIHTRELATNALNQIYSDCRIVCREKEHFDSEVVFIAAMAHLNEGSIFNKWFDL